ncbi:MAG TPA: diadenylate cyclase CdaA [Tepidisphaeraceae bacterium]|jgi:diadenylate cyclase|nr:diadenylate cyclase CdaA [Tepidisphaeraceae bacterium]
MYDFLNISTFFNAIRAYGWWRVGLEWLLIGSVVWWVVGFLQGTRGARMLKGIGFLLVSLYLIVTLLADRYHLEAIAFLYGQFLIIVSFAVVVVFQPELRRALMRLGETRLFRTWSHQFSDEIDAVVETAVFLSRRKIGGLIAIEREIGLGGIAESGTKLNADLTAPLLQAIFWPNSPLHDLGVIISQGRIAYAGVQFPLAESGELERELGSRHRAAVGLSQETDAIVLVVSEETGDISIAERGQLIRKLTPDALRGLLLELLGRPEAAPLQRVAA